MLVDAGLLTGVEEIDRQHQKIFEKTNELVAASGAGASRAVVQAYLTFLVDYIGRHFETEEAVMEGFNYPGLAVHRDQHKMFYDGLVLLSGQYALTLGTRSRAVSREVASQVKIWVRDHINDHDQEMAAYLREKLKLP
jgi:hemerythrin